MLGSIAFREIGEENKENKKTMMKKKSDRYGVGGINHIFLL